MTSFPVLQSWKKVSVATSMMTAKKTKNRIKKVMKVLVYFPRKKVDIFFEGAMLESIIKRACRNNEVTIIDKINKDVDIANFINLNAASTLAIRNAIGLSIPTILWMFWANNDNQARI